MSLNTNVTKFKEIWTSSSEKIKEFVKTFSTILIRILDKIVNGLTIKEKDGSLQHKYYNYFISIVLILILCLFYYLNEKQNLFTIKNTKYEILVALLLIGFSIYCFLFFAYRNDTNWTEDTTISGDAYAKIYRSDTRNIINTTTNSATINKDNLKKTLTSKSQFVEIHLLPNGPTVYYKQDAHDTLKQTHN